MHLQAYADSEGPDHPAHPRSLTSGANAQMTLCACAGLILSRAFCACSKTEKGTAHAHLNNQKPEIHQVLFFYVRQTLSYSVIGNREMTPSKEKVNKAKIKIIIFALFCYRNYIIRYRNIQIHHFATCAASVAQLDAPSDWRPGGRGFNPRRGREHSFVEIDHELFSTVILSLPLIQEGQLSVSGERMCTILVNRLED